jgi:hypothetical protein
VDSVFAAEAAVFVHFQLFRGILLVFRRVVITLFAFVASKHDFDAHIGTSIYNCLPASNWQNGGFYVPAYFYAHKIDPSADR